MAAHGGELADGLEVRRTFLTTRSVEFDALLVAAAPPPAPDAPPGPGAVDPRVVVMLQEAYRHAKAIGAWGDGVAALTEAGVASDAPGIVLGGTPESVFAQVNDLLAGHRVWERFTAG
nr:hypothetical protein [Actinokineospora globicatena]